MDERNFRVAILLATYNGERYVQQQILSLKSNITAFSLHWLDDQSTDATREIVRAATKNAAISVKEWHEDHHVGVPAAYFRLLEQVDSDIYLFCDQDDIWQPGKIDATVQNLLPEMNLPVMCFSDPLLFQNSEPDKLYRLLDTVRTTAERATQESRAFIPMVGYGHTEGFTRPLRDIYMRHSEIAKGYAYMHDMWMYTIAVAAGTARLMQGVPTTLYRRHSDNVSAGLGGWRGEGYLSVTWKQMQLVRRGIARHARGFILASRTLPASPKLDHLLGIARVIATLDQRLPIPTVFRLLLRGETYPSKRLSLQLAFACLCSSAGA